MIEVEKLSKIYGTFSAIRDVTFRVEPGEIMGFLGPNGAGKTTSMRILSGFLPATSGTARVAGFDVAEDSMAVRQRLGYLPETPPLYLDMTVESYLHFVAQIKRVSPGDRSQRVNHAIERCGLTEKRQVLIRKLSKGFKQRVGLAQAVVHDPPVIILDEPTVGLDPKQIIEVRNLIKSLAGDHTIILSTHILPEVSMTCDRVVIINRGQVVATGTPSELVAQLQGEQQLLLQVEGSRALITQTLANIPDLRVLQIQLASAQAALELGDMGSESEESRKTSESAESSEAEVAGSSESQVALEAEATAESPAVSGSSDSPELATSSDAQASPDPAGSDQGDGSEADLTGEHRWTVQVGSSTQGDRWVRDVSTALVQAGAGIYEIRRSQASLEDIFLQLTTQEGLDAALQEANS